MSRIFSYAKQMLGFVLFVFVAGFGCETESSMPYLARVYVNPTKRTYISPPCLQLTSAQESLLTVQLKPARTMHDSTAALARVTGLLPTVAQDVHEQDLSADSRCADMDGFSMKRRSLSGELLEKAGLLPKLPSRWNPDGSWNY